MERGELVVARPWRGLSLRRCRQNMNFTSGHLVTHIVGALHCCSPYYGFRFKMTYDGRTFIFVHLDRDIESKYVLCLLMSFNERK